MCDDCRYPGELAQQEPYDDAPCDGCTCCTAADCVPALCGEDDYGRFRCPCTCD